MCILGSQASGSSDFETPDPSVNLEPDSLASETPPLYPGHIPSNGFQKALLSVGSATMAITNPWRGGKKNVRSFHSSG